MKRVLLIMAAAVALPLVAAVGCGVDGNIIRIEDRADDTYDVYVKDHVDDKPADAVRVRLDDKYKATCVVGAQYPQCKKEYDNTH